MLYCIACIVLEKPEMEARADQKYTALHLLSLSLLMEG